MEKRYIIKVVKDGRALSWGMKLTEDQRRILHLALTQITRYNYLYKFEIKGIGNNGDN